MTRGRPLIALALATLLLLTGCLTATVPEDVPEEPLDAAAFARERQLSRIEAAWGGEMTRTLMDRDVSLGMVQGSGFRYPPQAVWGLGDAVVPEGAERMEVTLTWSDPTITGVYLAYSPANSPRSVDAGSATKGEPILIPLTPDIVDRPGSKESRWRFALRGEGVSTGTVHVQVVIHRLADLSTWPVPFDAFADRTHVTVLDRDVSTRPPGIYTTQDSFPYQAMDRAVPPGTRALLVNVTVQKFRVDGKDAEVEEARLAYHTTTGTAMRWADAPEGPDGNRTYRWVIPVEPEETDSPYAKDSEWGMRVFIESSDRVGPVRCGYCLPREIDFHITVVATTLSPKALKAGA